MDATYSFVQDMGGRASGSKCLHFSSTPQARRRLKRRVWPAGVGMVPVALHARDLGGHFDSSAHRCAPTLTARLRAASDAARE
eukprot:1350035-Alexandrium_andersonii.AAC.1